MLIEGCSTILSFKCNHRRGDRPLSEKNPKNPFDPWSFLPFNNKFIFPESDDDVEKKLKELKVIESWLTFNLEFTRSVIKTIEVKTEALNALRDFNKSCKNKNMEQFVDEMNEKIIGSSVKNAENWWRTLETQMSNFIEETMQKPIRQTTKKRSRGKAPAKGTLKKRSIKKNQ